MLLDTGHRHHRYHKLRQSAVFVRTLIAEIEADEKVISGPSLSLPVRIRWIWPFFKSI